MSVVGSVFCGRHAAREETQHDKADQPAQIKFVSAAMAACRSASPDQVCHSSNLGEGLHGICPVLPNPTAPLSWQLSKVNSLASFESLVLHAGRGGSGAPVQTFI